MLEYSSPDIWYHCSHTYKLPVEKRGVETQLKFFISFEMKKNKKKIIAHDCFTDHKGKTTIIFHPTPLIPSKVAPLEP